MVLLDSSALIAFLAGEAAEGRVRALLREGGAAIVSVNLAETVDVMARRYGVALERTRAVVEPLLDEAIAVISPGAVAAWRAGAIRSRHYGRVSRPLSLADCLLLASAGQGDAIATLDRDVIEVATIESIPHVDV